ncbi:unnamed protein product [Spirodela intermedia]|uniref:Uncharacterized protein n=1 Tax=Spirodela intermedia TaxID=51605 RepID=A0A7I8JRI7_SPIIN|nr:unnamed protein product [Spirodela intermedia]CAA6672790.1 unnamed protein product [Spirodela intermedia]
MKIARSKLICGRYRGLVYPNEIEIDFQQGGNSRIPYVHVPAARMISLFPLTKHPLYLRFSSGTGTEIGTFSTLFTLVTGGFGEDLCGYLSGGDARLTSVLISFLIYLGEKNKIEWANEDHCYNITFISG